MNAAKSGTSAERLKQQRNLHRRMTKFCSEAMKWQMARSAFFVCENPQQSEAWKLPEFAWLFKTDRAYSGDTDMGQRNLRDPKDGFYYRKATKQCSNLQYVQRSLSSRCSGNLL